jgi:hypothetical protein
MKPPFEVICAAFAGQGSRPARQTRNSALSATRQSGLFAIGVRKNCVTNFAFLVGCSAAAECPFADVFHLAGFL